MNHASARESVVAAARSLFSRSLTHGSTGNLSVRVDDCLLVTPTGSSLGTVEPDELSLISMDGEHLDGRAPSKESFLHLAMLKARLEACAVVHTHSTYSVAVSCLGGVDANNVLPPLTAYYALRVGRVPLLPYHAPGDSTLGPAAEAAARHHHAMLLRNHGPIVAGTSLSAAMDAMEELEETAKLYLLLGDRAKPLTDTQARALGPG
ncbi:aldolase [Mycolicibacterium wolinskyi]|uniref:3-oxo-tetronate 4-phosphate decarboxylase n=1 Tax=Mycolicibacterium wolinskyi TaxID=59750 RepID=A0A132PBY5_9MYCO|nr:3-oxo-tetronate 4-phosphate decarboxylase [Mycolicibacterium wolinskyi]KWX19804.1 aldolase [Mycolicibacterium wolinskyi]